jgi:hypothetical protein
MKIRDWLEALAAPLVIFLFALSMSSLVVIDMVAGYYGWY